MAEQVTLKVLDASGAEVGSRQVEAQFVAARVPASLLHQVVRWQRAKRRSGTHKVQTRAEMTGGGAKPWKQKGTGNARAGSNTSPLWVGGGIAHGPKIRDYEFRLNKRERRQALIGALSARQRDGRLLLVRDFQIEKCSTKSAVKLLQALGIPHGKSAVVIAPSVDSPLGKSLRNIPGVVVVDVKGLNVYDILRAKYLVMAEASLDAVVERVTIPE